ncbi:MAG: hypothetical protein IJ228_14075 [Succinivibrio sp.]|nr:hypothetical protein [Succinivibrio sp.]
MVVPDWTVTLPPALTMSFLPEELVLPEKELVPVKVTVESALLYTAPAPPELWLEVNTPPFMIRVSAL